MAGCVDLVNDYTNNELVESELKAIEKKCMESLLKFLRSPRFSQIISNYTKEEDRELFEAEFIRASWDKPDLSADEVNLYVNVCVDYINLKNISAHMEKLKEGKPNEGKPSGIFPTIATLLAPKPNTQTIVVVRTTAITGPVLDTTSEVKGLDPKLSMNCLSLFLHQNKIVSAKMPITKV